MCLWFGWYGSRVDTKKIVFFFFGPNVKTKLFLNYNDSKVVTNKVADKKWRDIEHYLWEL